jgi:hypothetical protein
MADAAQWIRVVAAYGAARYVNRKLTRYRMHQNASAQTRVAVWHKANTDTSEFAIDELRSRGYAIDDVSLAIRRSVRRVNVAITTGHINKSLRYDKFRALGEYWENRRMFASCNGIAELIKGFVLLMLPSFLRSWLRRCLAFTSRFAQKARE